MSEIRFTQAVKVEKRKEIKMKIGAGKIIGAAMFAAGVAAIWLWPHDKEEGGEASTFETNITLVDVNAVY